ncbi:MAG: hypothetical protein IJ046_00160 [Clostridia bacterium]|nr:hypothetical protein [Clostridia bacterium]
MKRLWLFVVILSLAVSIFSVFYVAVGATAAESRSVSIPKEVIAERRAYEKKLEYLSDLENGMARSESLESSPASLTLAAPEYEGAGYYEMEYTILSARVEKEISQEMDTDRFCEFSYYSDGILSEGYTFVLVDVIIKSKDMQKQMYLVNSASIEGGRLLGFSGQRFKNTAALHAELFPGEEFETTLVFALPEERVAGSALYINNFGYGTANATCAYIDLNLGDNNE